MCTFARNCEREREEGKNPFARGIVYRGIFFQDRSIDPRRWREGQCYFFLLFLINVSADPEKGWDARIPGGIRGILAFTTSKSPAARHFLDSSSSIYLE